jgi:hypothetical protein
MQPLLISFIIFMVVFFLAVFVLILVLAIQNNTTPTSTSKNTNNTNNKSKNRSSTRSNNKANSGKLSEQNNNISNNITPGKLNDITPGKLNDRCTNTQGCTNGYSCVNGQCKANEHTECNIDDDCLPSLVCRNASSDNKRICVNLAKVASSVTPITVSTRETKSTQDKQQKSNHRNTSQKNTLKHAKFIRDVMSSTSRDSERNSEGSTDVIQFDVMSNSTNDNIDDNSSVSTPCHEEDDKIVCRREYIDINSSSPVIDVCSFSNINVFVLEDGNCICEDDKGARYRVSNNIKINNLTIFGGYLHALDKNGNIYYLPNSKNKVWNWTNVKFTSVKNIKVMTTTLDNKFIWVQDDNKGYLYETPNKLVETVDIIYPTRRTYGKDEKHYIEIDSYTKTAVVHPSKEKLKNVYDAILTYHNNVITISVKDSAVFSRVILVDWKPYYIKT